tara:strand:- start:348 stop:509 length:162 start_codon:yes stop_codon:yes gene_type:complete
MGRIASTIIEKVAERGGIISPPTTPTPKIYNQHKKILPSQSLAIVEFRYNIQY